MKPTHLLARLALACLLTASIRAQNVALQSTTITSEGRGEMVSTDTETKITFRDKVVVTGTNMKLSCDYLEVIVIRTGDKTATLGKLEKFRSLLATGNVLMAQGDREAACGRAEVLPGEDKVILSDNPVLVDRDQGTRAAGKTITLLRAQRQVLIDQPVLTAPPIKDLGVDKEKKPAAPTAPASTPAASEAPQN